MELLINLIITMAVLAIAFFYFNSRIKQALKAENLLREVQLEVQSLVRGLNETTSRNLDLVEDRIGKLETLLKEADKKMVQLSKETGKHQASSETYSHLVKTGKPIRHNPEVPDTPLPLFDTPQPKLETVPKLSTKDRVLEMNAQGFSADLISSRLGITMAEVELILSLHLGR